MKKPAEIYVVFCNGEIWGTHTTEWAAQDQVDCACLPEDRGERFTIVKYFEGYGVPVRRQGE